MRVRLYAHASGKEAEANRDFCVLLDVVCGTLMASCRGRMAARSHRCSLRCSSAGNRRLRAG